MRTAESIAVQCSAILPFSIRIRSCPLQCDRVAGRCDPSEVTPVGPGDQPPAGDEVTLGELVRVLDVDVGERRDEPFELGALAGGALGCALWCAVIDEVLGEQLGDHVQVVVVEQRLRGSGGDLLGFLGGHRATVAPAGWAPVRSARRPPRREFPTVVGGR